MKYLNGNVKTIVMNLYNQHSHAYYNCYKNRTLTILAPCNCVHSKLIAK